LRHEVHPRSRLTAYLVDDKRDIVEGFWDLRATQTGKRTGKAWPLIRI
jgi:hypothetical protein